MIFKHNKSQLFFITFFSFVSCKNLNDNNNKIIVNNNNSFSVDNNEVKNKVKGNILKKEVLKREESIGVVSLKEGYNNAKIRLYDETGLVWKSFIITDDFEDKNIVPFAFKSDDRLLVFQVFDKNDLFYKVKVNENKNLFKFIRKDDKDFVYEPWEKHILKVFSVEFDYKLNPQREEPIDNSKTKSYDKEQFYHPVKVKDEWLMIRDDDDNESWIKWKDNKGSLIILLYYSA